MRRVADWLSFAVLIALLLGAPCAHAVDQYPLRPPDTSSPRATLQGFIETTDGMYRGMKDLVAEYANSGRLYPSSDEMRKYASMRGDAAKSIRYLDLSRVPPVLKDTVAIERVLQLREILDRIDLPALADVPDQQTMTHVSPKRWRLPNTEIDFVLIENGPRAGEYLVSADTVDRLPEFFQEVSNLPYEPGPAAELYKVYHSLSGGGLTTIYDAYLSSPGGLMRIIPPRWMLGGLPNWARVRLAEVAVWQWLGLGFGLCVGALVVFLSHRVSRRRYDTDRGAPGGRWQALAVPVALIFVAGLLVPFLCLVLRIGATPRIGIEYARTTVMYLAAAWLAIAASVVIGDAIVASERLTGQSLDSQLIRLGTRLVGVSVAIAILVRGGDELGFPALSILAGLGVGGLAVALAAQTTIANLIGSLLIAIEKPFRVGQYVKIGSSEGTVEDVGFRTTRIRTLDNSLLSIPSSAVVNTTVENLSVRTARSQRFLVQVTYDTPREKLERLVARIRQLIVDHPLAEVSTCHVRFNSFAESSLDILVIFHLRVDDYATELNEREAILLCIMDLVSEMGVKLAFPTRTLYVEDAAEGVAKPPGPNTVVIGLAGRS
jgi:MscS family membrane protein